MDESDWIAIASAIIALLSVTIAVNQAVIARHQAKIARRAADSAAEAASAAQRQAAAAERQATASERELDALRHQLTEERSRRGRDALAIAQRSFNSAHEEVVAYLFRENGVDGSRNPEQLRRALAAMLGALSEAAGTSSSSALATQFNQLREQVVQVSELDGIRAVHDGEVVPCPSPEAEHVSSSRRSTALRALLTRMDHFPE